MGDGGGCPDSEGRFNCVGCGVTLAVDSPSSLCVSCREDGHEAGPVSEHGPDCRGCARQEAEWEDICEWETENHIKHTELGQFVEACDECQVHGYNKDVDFDITYITTEVSEKAYKEKFNAA